MPSKTAKKSIKEEKSNEFAVIETGGKQYKVSVGDVISIEKLPEDKKEGEKFTFDKVLLVDDGNNTTIGDPYIPEAKVEAEFQEEGKGKKIAVMKYKAKSRYFKNKGHRQPFAKVKILAIK